MKHTVIIDNGHGRTTPGKESPDGKLQEWSWTRKLARAIADELTHRNFNPILLVPGEDDVILSKRVADANNIAKTHPDAILISLHTNASASDGQWHSPNGWCVFVANNASANSQRLAKLLTYQAAKRHLLGNRYTPPEGFRRASFAIIRDTICPAVLTENLFHDNQNDVDFLLSEHGLEEIAALHVNAISNYFQ